MKQLYALFEQQNGKWVRISTGAYTKQAAVRNFQNALLAPFFGAWGEDEEVKGQRSLRVVKRGVTVVND